MLKLCVVVFLLATICDCYPSNDFEFIPLHSYLQQILLDLLKDSPQTIDIITVNLGRTAASNMIRFIVHHISSEFQIAKSENAIGFNVKRSCIILLDGTNSRLFRYLEEFIGTGDEYDSYFQYAIHRPLQYFIIVSDQIRPEYFNFMHRLGVVNCLYVYPAGNPIGFEVYVTDLAYRSAFKLYKTHLATPFSSYRSNWNGTSFKVVVSSLAPHTLISEDGRKMLKSFDWDLLREAGSYFHIDITLRRILGNLKGNLLHEKVGDELNVPYSALVTRYAMFFHSSRRIPLPEDPSVCIIVNFESIWDFTGILHYPFQYLAWIPVIISTTAFHLLFRRFKQPYNFLVLFLLTIVYTTTSFSHLLVATFNPGSQSLAGFSKSNVDLFLDSSDVMKFVTFNPQIQHKVKTYESLPNDTKNFAELIRCAHAHYRLHQSRGDPKFYIVDRKLYSGMAELATIRNFLLQAHLEQFIWKLFEVGIYQKMSDYYAYRSSGGIMIRLRDDPVLRLEDLKYFWVLLAAGWIAGCAVFGLEFTEWKTYRWAGLKTVGMPVEVSERSRSREEVEVFEVTELL